MKGLWIICTGTFWFGSCCGPIDLSRAVDAAEVFPPTPRAAVARIIVPEGQGATSYGSGTLIDVRDQFGLVVTNWHVVRDASGLVEVVFPNGFRSQARPLKVDADWDLAALVIWCPPVKPVLISKHAPQPGDVLTICGYGRGTYREATGRCTQYLAPGIDFPREMVELNVEARQGDSGGPIFNRRGELAGVLFGATRGTTLGSFAGRVDEFLASLAPNIGDAPTTIAARGKDKPSTNGPANDGQPGMEREDPSAEPSFSRNGNDPKASLADMAHEPARNAARWDSMPEHPVQPPVASLAAEPPSHQHVTWRDVVGYGWFQQAKTMFALLGVAAVLLQLVRWTA